MLGSTVCVFIIIIALLLRANDDISFGEQFIITLIAIVIQVLMKKGV